MAPFPETFADFSVGDEVYCLAWLGIPFEVASTDDSSGRISLQGKVPSSLPNGPQVDIYPQNMFLLTHNQWDQIWYWPDRAGDSYLDVFERFVANHADGEIVTAYYSEAIDMLGMPMILEDPAKAQSFRLDLSAAHSRRQVLAQPVAAISGEALAVVYDPAIPEGQWLPTGPSLPASIEMRAYRWSLVAGGLVLNREDFAVPVAVG
jgi:hypothetical protein